MFDIISNEQLWAVLRALILLVSGIVFARLSKRLIEQIAVQYLTSHHFELAKRFSYYAILSIFIMMALRQLGFSLTVLLGTAGILSVAIGFASQTAASNLISGFFLIAEKPFAIGDIIKIGDTTGEVLSIDLVSVKLRTFDNLFVRIPNEKVMKSEVTTLTKFPIRRLDLKFGVAYKEEIAKVREVLKEVATNNPLCLDEPLPLFIFTGFGDSALEIQFSVWAARENFLALRNSIQEEIKLAFDKAGIEIPFPHRTLYTGSVTDPFPIRLISTDETRDKP